MVEAALSAFLTSSRSAAAEGLRLYANVVFGQTHLKTAQQILFLLALNRIIINLGWRLFMKVFLGNRKTKLQH